MTDDWAIGKPLRRKGNTVWALDGDEWRPLMSRPPATSPPDGPADLNKAVGVPNGTDKFVWDGDEAEWGADSTTGDQGQAAALTAVLRRACNTDPTVRQPAVDELVDAYGTATAATMIAKAQAALADASAPLATTRTPSVPLWNGQAVAITHSPDETAELTSMLTKARSRDSNIAGTAMSRLAQTYGVDTAARLLSERDTR